jgi:uncharacterized protein
MNPFEYQRPLPPADVIDREPETGLILELCESGALIRLDAPRRYGKTSLVGKVLDRGADSGGVGVLVDLDGVLTAQDVADRIALAYRGLEGPIQSFLRPILGAIGIGVGVGPVRVSARARGEVGQQKLLDLLNLPNRIAERGEARVIVAFDEFQEVLKIEGMDGAIRSQIQHHADFASYIFTGSEPRLMNALFGDRRRPFWEQARPERIGRLDAEDIAVYIAERFASFRRDPGRALALLLDSAAGHPQRAMLLANQLFEHTPVGKSADEHVWELARDAAAAMLSPSFDAEWRRTETNQQRVLRAPPSRLSWGRRPSSRSTPGCIYSPIRSTPSGSSRASVLRDTIPGRSAARLTHKFAL